MSLAPKLGCVSVEEGAPQGPGLSSREPVTRREGPGADGWWLCQVPHLGDALRGVNSTGLYFSEEFSSTWMCLVLKQSAPCDRFLTGR